MSSLISQNNDLTPDNQTMMCLRPKMNDDKPKRSDSLQTAKHPPMQIGSDMARKRSRVESKDK